MDILLVDDEASLRRTLRLTLGTMGHAVEEAASGEQALTVLRQRPFDLALLDVRLRKESGLDVLPRLRSQAPDLPVVVMTAYASVDTAVEAMRRGAVDYLPKPFTPDQLRVVLGRLREVQGLKR